MDIIEARHPGERIKTEVFPAKMSVTKAAELIGVGRPALSNLLNGKASLSTEMATRIEKVFGVPREDLLEMQAQYDAFRAKQKSAPTNAKAYVPQFLAIKANDIENWASHNIAARSRFAVFLRTLVHSTGCGLSEVDFPGNDDSQRAGWDGRVMASEGTAWVPSGRSGWEFGTNEDPKTKAEKDFKKSVTANDANDRASMEFVFVTPRRWAGKNDWVIEKKKKGSWKDVRAYDSSDLEQWVEQSLPGQAWFANETGSPAQGVRSLDKCWTDWANVATPPLPGSLFNSAIEEAKRKLVSRLEKEPTGPIVVAADSTDEALAFLAQCFSPEGSAELEPYRYLILVFDKAGILPKLAGGTRPFISVVHSHEVEIELAPYAEQMHSIVVYPRNSINAEPDIVLEPASFEVFDSALKGIGKNRDEIRILANESGHSLTVLRRRLATVEAVRIPLWATQQHSPESLIAFMLVGAWHDLNETDKAGLSLLAGDRTYEILEKDCQRLIQLNDAPLWSIGTYRGVVSKIDLLYAIARYMTSDDLKRYFDVARMVLGEDDPSLDLAEEQRWAASIHGKTREFSPAFRQGISETLVLLAVHGVSLFKARLGIDTEIEAALVVRDLLKDPLTTRMLEANNRDLPLYAEAAPTEFLSIIERDLKTDSPAIIGLLRPAGSGIFGSPSRTGLLWALEGLAWNPETLPRTVMILARLAQVEINDNWVNKPVHSLAAIFRSWMPQTAANNDDRLALMKALFNRFPGIAWTLCVAQFGNHHETGDYSHKPTWRPDGYGYGEPFPTWEPILEFAEKMIELALTRPCYSVLMLSDLVDRLHDLTDADQDRVWGLVNAWAKTASDSDKIALREKIRVSTLSRGATLRAKKSKQCRVAAAAKYIHAALEPSDLLDKHAWLFKNTWIEESADELEEIENINYEEREIRIRKQRVDALKEIHNQYGITGLLNMAARSGAPGTIGTLSAKHILDEEELLSLVIFAFQKRSENESAARSSEWLIREILGVMPNDQQRETVLRSAITAIGPENAVHLLALAPFGEATWSLVSSYGEEIETRYWKEVVPGWLQGPPAEIAKAVDMLMNARRPRAAFELVKYHPEKLPVHLLFKLLTVMAQGGDDKAGEYLLEHHYVKRAFECINKTFELSLEQKAGLEFAYLDVLDRAWDRHAKSAVPNLERYIEDHPEVLVQAIVWAYKRNDCEEDPSEFSVAAETTKSMAERGYKLIHALKRIPGSDEQGHIDAKRLAKWTGTVRKSCAELSRIEIADAVIGELLASAPIGEDGAWPCEAVRMMMEDIQSEGMMRGAHTGVYNSRGIHARGPGGNQERQLADKYRKWAQQIRMSSPYVASELLMKLTETYEREAAREDTEAKINRRLR
ncbi:HigA family addiction module antidote protein [Aeromonas veronii]|uniref:HigA family addiction module antitoxin n=1 Tax=Aeromonas TaxID=642 RepID=UPI001F41D153|nr:HigA family addiction module antitoxin [Aeromonas veronii]MCF5849138.1 HigA family addiction module antidote protein [Aeromonas veronii]